MLRKWRESILEKRGWESSRGLILKGGSKVLRVVEVAIFNKGENFKAKDH